eukprot:TRINITY_DN7595_c0_g1_i1.p1 TRINITY_DN7595_c0_g1~~TRINITY_DN7595_c0_g1_i1.p1  ORF type:complete len:1389 (+),score=281.41 TRINITY_DN7595_c0_g1_i1:420-4169(+)
MLSTSIEEFRPWMLENRPVLEWLTEENATNALQQGVLAPLEQLFPRDDPQSVLIVVDGVHESPAILDLINTQLMHFPPSVKILLTARPDALINSKLHWLPKLVLEPNDPRNLADIHDYIWSVLPQSLAEFAESKHVLMFVETLVKKSSGNFLYAQAAVEAAVESENSIIDLDDKGAREMSLRMLSRLNSLPVGLYGLFSQFLHRTFPTEPSFENVRTLLTVLAVVGEPVDQSFLQNVVGIDPKQLTRQLSQLSLYLRPLLTTTESTQMEANFSVTSSRIDLPSARSDISSSLFSVGAVAIGIPRPLFVLFHNSFAEWLTAPDREGQTHWLQRRQGHMMIARAGLSCAVRGYEGLPIYFLRHLPYHLLHAGLFTECLELLTSLRWITHKCSVLSLAAVCNDYAHALSPEFAIGIGSARQVVAQISVALTASVPSISEAAAQAETRLPHILHSLICTQLLARLPFNDPIDSGLVSASAAQTHTIEGAEAIMQQLLAEKQGNWLVPRLAVLSVHPMQSQTLLGHAKSVKTFDFSSNFELVTGSSDLVNLWNGQTGEKIKVVCKPSKTLTCLAITRRGDIVVVGFEDGSMVGYSVATGAEVLKFTVQHEKRVMVLVVAAEEGPIISGSEDMLVRTWNLANGEPGIHYRARGAVTSLALAPGHLVAGSRDKLVYIWPETTDEPQGGSKPRELSGHTGSVEAVAVSGDGTRIASGGDDKLVIVWDFKEGTPIRTLSGHPAWVTSVAMWDEFIASASDDGTVLVWDAQRGRIVEHLYGHFAHVSRLRRMGQSRFVTASDDKTVRIWNLDLLPTPEPLSEPSQTSGTTALSTGESQETLAQLSGHIVLSALAVTADLSFILAGCKVGTIVVSDGTTAAPVGEMSGHTSTVRAIAVLPVSQSPDIPTHRCISASSDNTVRVWDVVGLQQLYLLEGHSGEVCCLSVSPLGTTFCSGGSDNNVLVWDFSKPNQEPVVVATLEHDDCVLAVHVSHSPVPKPGSSVGLSALLFDSSASLRSSLGVTAAAPLPPVAESSTISVIKKLQAFRGARQRRHFAGSESLLVGSSAALDGLVASQNGRNSADPVAEDVPQSPLPSGKLHIVAVSSNSSSIWTVDSTTYETIDSERHDSLVENDYIELAALSEDGTCAVFASDDSVVAWDVRNGARLHEFKPAPGRVADEYVGVAVSGGYVVAADSLTLTVWSLVTGAMLTCFPTNGGLCAVHIQRALGMSAVPRRVVLGTSKGDLLPIDLVPSGKKAN